MCVSVVGVLICVLTHLNLEVTHACTHMHTHTPPKKAQILCFVPSKARGRQWVLKEWSPDFFSSPQGSTPHLLLKWIRDDQKKTHSTAVIYKTVRLEMHALFVALTTTTTTTETPTKRENDQRLRVEGVFLQLCVSELPRAQLKNRFCDYG